MTDDSKGTWSGGKVCKCGQCAMICVVRSILRDGRGLRGLEEVPR